MRAVAEGSTWRCEVRASSLRLLDPGGRSYLATCDDLQVERDAFLMLGGRVASRRRETAAARLRPKPRAGIGDEPEPAQPVERPRRAYG
jgi:hypothetical protein